MSRVLSTEQAKAAIGQVQSIINGGFTDQISALDAQGRVLSDPNVWDGPLAAQFRGSTWPETKAALDKAKDELEQLRGRCRWRRRGDIDLHVRKGEDYRRMGSHPEGSGTPENRPPPALEPVVRRPGRPHRRRKTPRVF